MYQHVPGPIERTYLHLVASHERRNESHRQPVNADFQIQKAFGADISPNLLQILAPLNWIIKSSSFKSISLAIPNPMKLDPLCFNVEKCSQTPRKVQHLLLSPDPTSHRKVTSSHKAIFWETTCLWGLCLFSGATLLVSGLGS